MHEQFMVQVQAGDMKAIDAAMPELHATSAGLKSFVTALAADAIEGGHSQVLAMCCMRLNLSMSAYAHCMYLCMVVLL